MSITNLFLLISLGLIFPLLVWSTLKKPTLGLGVLLFSLPALNLSKRLFAENHMLFPSLETIAIILLWGSVQIRNVMHGRPAMLDTKDRVAILIFIGSGLISSLTARDMGISLRILLAGGIAPLLCFSIASRHVRSLKDAEPVIYGFLSLVIQVAIFTALAFDRRLLIAPSGYDYELIGWLYREANPVAIFGAPSVSIGAIVTGIPLAIWYGVHGRGKWQSQLSSLAIIVAILGTAVMSLSRGSWLGVLIAAAGSLPLVFRQLRISSVLLFIATVIFLYICGGIDFIYRAIGWRLEETSFLRNIDVRGANQILALQSASIYFFKGLGLGHYPEIYLEYPAAPASGMMPLWFAHSIFLTLIPEIGLIGAAAFCYLFISRLVWAIRTRKGAPFRPQAELFYALSIGIIGYIVIASTAGAHLIASFTIPASSNYFAAPALIVVYSFLGMLSNTKLRRG